MAVPPEVNFAWLLALAVALGTEQDARAEPAIPMHVNADTSRQFIEDSLRYWNQFYVDRYRMLGHRDEAWDGAAMQLLAQTASHVSVGRTPIDLRIDAGAAAVNAGCDDPLVRLAYGIALSNAGRRQEALEQLERALANKTHGYGGWFEFVLAIWLSETATSQVECKEVRASLGSRFLHALVDGSIHHESARHALRFLQSGIGRFPVEQQLQLADSLLNTAGVDPWIAKTLAGEFHWQVAQAQSGRRSTGNHVVAGWMAHGQHVGLARRLLKEAYWHDPTYPEPATTMIALADWRGVESPRLWFDRAVAAQFDSPDAYRNYLAALGGRRDGEDAVYAFGVECARTSRFDTDVPTQFARALARIRSDSGGDLAIYNRPGALTELERVLSGRQRFLASHDRSDELANEWKDSIGVACRLGRWDIAASMFEQMGAEQSQRWNEELERETSATVRAGVRALSGPFMERLQHAQRLATRDGDLDGAVAILRNVIAENRDKDAAVVFQSRLIWLQAEADLKAGKRVVVPADAEMTGWRVVRGQFTGTADGVIAVRSTGRGAMAYLPLAPGPRFELEAEIEAPLGFERSSRGVDLYLGDPVAPSDRWTGVRWRPSEQLVACFSSTTDASWDRRRCSISMPGKMRLLVWDGAMTVYINGWLTHVEQSIESRSSREPLIGLGLPADGNGKEMAIRSVAIRALSEKPENEATVFQRGIDEAYRLVDAGQPETAIARLASVEQVPELTQHEPITRFVRRSLENRQRVKINEPLDVLAFAADPADWHDRFGDWRIDDRRLIGTTTAGSIRRSLALDLKDFDLSFRVDWDRKTRASLMFEFFLGMRVPNSQYTAVLRRANGELSYQLQAPSNAEPTLLSAGRSGPPLKLRMRRQGGTFELYRDGQRFATDRLPHPDRPGGFICFVVYSNQAGVPITFSDIRLTPLSFK